MIVTPNPGEPIPRAAPFLDDSECTARLRLNEGQTQYELVRGSRVLLGAYGEFYDAWERQPVGAPPGTQRCILFTHGPVVVGTLEFIMQADHTTTRALLSVV